MSRIYYLLAKSCLMYGDMGRLTWPQVGPWVLVVDTASSAGSPCYFRL